jgi:hypothetical protein
MSRSGIIAATITKAQSTRCTSPEPEALKSSRASRLGLVVRPLDVGPLPLAGQIQARNHRRDFGTGCESSPRDGTLHTFSYICTRRKQ